MLQRGHAVGVVRAQVGIVLVLVDELVPSVVEAEVEIRLVADDGVGPSIVDTKSNEIDLLALDGAFGDGRILLLEIVCKFWAVVTSI